MGRHLSGRRSRSTATTIKGLWPDNRGCIHLPANVCLRGEFIFFLLMDCIFNDFRALDRCSGIFKVLWTVYRGGMGGLWLRVSTIRFDWFRCLRISILSLDLIFWYNSAFGSPVARVQGIGYVQELVARLTHTPIETHNSSTNSTLNDNPITFPLGQSLYVDATHEVVVLNGIISGLSHIYV